MSVMPDALKRPVENDWLPTVATVISCEQTGHEGFSEEGYTPPQYRISFSYVADGRVLEGSYRATLPRSADTALRFFTTPKKPSRNTGSDILGNRWLRWVGGIIGIGLALLASWLWGDQDWFRN